MTKEFRKFEKNSSDDQRGSALIKALIVILVIIGIGVALLVWKAKVAKHETEIPTKLTEQDFLVLLKGEDPAYLKRLADDPSARQKLLENFRQTLAFANQAKKEGLIDDEEVKQDLGEIKLFITASSYDQEKHKGKGPFPPFGFIEEDEVKKFYDNRFNQALFDEFLQKAVERAKKQGLLPKDADPTEEDIERAKSDFAKVRISAEEFKSKSSELDPDFKRKVDLRVKLQQASYLARRYSEDVLRKKLEVSDSEIEKYLKEHPELDTRAEKRAKAEELLARVKAGEDFAQLAKQYSEDPGSKDKGGLYQNIRKGSFIPEFETVALSLQPGQIAPTIVESRYGYHIIKLERLDYVANRDGSDTPVYDARHILLSTNVRDPENPLYDNIPLKEFIKEKLLADKQKQILDEIMKNNPIDLPADLPVPELSPEQIKQLEEMEKVRQEELKKLREDETQKSKSEKPRKEDGNKK